MTQLKIDQRILLSIFTKKAILSWTIRLKTPLKQIQTIDVMKNDSNDNTNMPKLMRMSQIIKLSWHPPSFVERKVAHLPFRDSSGVNEGTAQVKSKLE